MLHINATHFKMIFEIRLLQREKEKYNLINRVNGTFTFTSNFEIMVDMCPRIARLITDNVVL